MMIYTVKFSKKKAVAILIAMAIVIAAIILAVPKEGESAPTSAAVRVQTADDCLAYIESLGYTAESTPLEQKEVTIPETFDAVYTEYNRLQLECGFDLTDYKGKAATLYTYAVTNYPGEPDVRCDLLVRKDKVIGGNLYTTAIDGFMHGLRPIDG